MRAKTFEEIWNGTKIMIPVEEGSEKNIVLSKEVLKQLIKELLVENFYIGLNSGQEWASYGNGYRNISVTVRFDEQLIGDSTTSFSCD